MEQNKLKISENDIYKDTINQTGSLLFTKCFFATENKHNNKTAIFSTTHFYSTLT